MTKKGLTENFRSINGLDVIYVFQNQYIKLRIASVFKSLYIDDNSRVRVTYPDHENTESRFNGIKFNFDSHTAKSTKTFPKEYEISTKTFVKDAFPELYEFSDFTLESTVNCRAKLNTSLVYQLLTGQALKNQIVFDFLFKKKDQNSLTKTEISLGNQKTKPSILYLDTYEKTCEPICEFFSEKKEYHVKCNQFAFIISYLYRYSLTREISLDFYDKYPTRKKMSDELIKRYNNKSLFTDGVETIPGASLYSNSLDLAMLTLTNYADNNTDPHATDFINKHTKDYCTFPALVIPVKFSDTYISVFPPISKNQDDYFSVENISDVKHQFDGINNIANSKASKAAGAYCVNCKGREITNKHLPDFDSFLGENESSTMTISQRMYLEFLFDQLEKYLNLEFLEVSDNQNEYSFKISNSIPFNGNKISFADHFKDNTTLFGKLKIDFDTHLCDISLTFPPVHPSDISTIHFSLYNYMHRSSIKIVFERNDLNIPNDQQFPLYFYAGLRTLFEQNKTSHSKQELKGELRGNSLKIDSKIDLFSGMSLGKNIKGTKLYYNQGHISIDFEYNDF